jgi:hypothetical protein
VQQNYELTDKVLKLEQLCLQIKMEYKVDFQELDAMLQSNQQKNAAEVNEAMVVESEFIFN